MIAVLTEPRRYLWFALVCVGVFGAGTAALYHDDGRIADGVSIQGLSVGGLTVADAEAAVRRELVPRLPRELVFWQGYRSWHVAPAEIGQRALVEEAVSAAHALGHSGGLIERGLTRLRLAHQPQDVPLKVVVDPVALTARIEAIAAEINQPPRNARVSDYVDGLLYFEPEADGLEVDVAATVAAVSADGRFPPPGRIQVVATRTRPTITVDQLRSGLNTVLAEFQTSMSHGYYGEMKRNRIHNVRLCLAKLNGCLIQPGEVFSFNGYLGERKASDGFRSSYVFHRRPNGTIEERWEAGGGICQLATTMFNTVLRANLQIVERSPHSKPVHYVRPARDAAVYYGVKDLRFRNSLSHPILLWGRVDSDDNLVITIIGDRSDKTEVELESNFWYGGAGRGGSLWRTAKTPDGRVLVDRELVCESFYPYEPTTTEPD